MTTQEAINKIKHIQDALVNDTFLNPTREACLPLADALGMAIAALQASVPHVFTLEELSKKQGELIERETLPAWYESKGEKQFDGWELMLRNSEVGNYGILWRCWSHKPTADQMAATPWTKQEG